jgi:YD repeat-containing protein
LTQILGKTTTYAYDSADRLISVTDPASNLNQYGYDTEDNLISITDANNHTTYFAYDTMGRVIQTTFPSTLTETYGYDQLYDLTSKTDRKGQTIQYVYDSLYRMTSKTYPDETSASYVYDLVGKIQQVSDPTGTYAFAFDNMGRLIGTSTQYTFLPGYNFFQNSYSYDAASNRTSLTAPDGSTNTYHYDTLNRLSSLTNSLTGQFGFAYDALSRRTQLTRPNGVNTNYNYDSVSHLLSVLHQAGSTTLDGASYSYDYAGNRTSKTNYLNGTTWNYGYDAIYELLQVTHNGSTKESFSYDAVGNRLSSSAVPTYSYNPSNELTSNSSGNYTYDANGYTLSDPSGKSYTWDFENRLMSAVVPATGTVAFKYDPFGRRVQKASPLGTTNYLYDSKNLIEEMDASGNISEKDWRDDDQANKCGQRGGDCNKTCAPFVPLARPFAQLWSKRPRSFINEGCRWKSLPLTVLCVGFICVLATCGHDQESFYPSLGDAKKDGAVDRGWIPDYLPSSSRAIHEVGDLSPATAWCTFEFLPADSEGLRKNLKSIAVLPPAVSRIPNPRKSWWPSVLEGNLDLEKIHKAGFQLYMVEEPETPSSAAAFLFAIDWAQGRGLFYRTRE